MPVHTIFHGSGEGGGTEGSVDQVVKPPHDFLARLYALHGEVSKWTSERVKKRRKKREKAEGGGGESHCTLVRTHVPYSTRDRIALAFVSIKLPDKRTRRRERTPASPATRRPPVPAICIVALATVSMAVIDSTISLLKQNYRLFSSRPTAEISYTRVYAARGLFSAPKTPCAVALPLIFRTVNIINLPGLVHVSP